MMDKASNQAPEDQIAVVSDTHLNVRDPQSLSLFPRAVARDGDALYYRMEDENRRAFQACLNGLRKENPRAIIHTGDVTGGWRERGLANERARSLAQGVASSLASIAPTYYTLGNHDTGYAHPGSLEGSGINKESVDACEEIYGPLYWELPSDSGIHSIGIASPLAEYEGKDENLRARKADQEAFLRDTLYLHRSDPWALYLHDIGAVKSLSKVIGKHAENCTIVVAGDLHDPMKGSILKQYLRSPFSGFDKTARSLAGKFVLCPSTAPLWWKGYERLEMTYKDREAHAKRKLIEYPEDADRDVPSSSMIWGLKSMFARPRVD